MQQSPNIRWSDIYLGKENMSNALKYLAEARSTFNNKGGSGSVLLPCFERGIAWEITPVRHFQVEVSGHRRRPSTIMDKDEGLRKETGGTVTAGNASSISGGAAALVLVSGETSVKHVLQVIGKITAYADAAQVLCLVYVHNDY
ncbi:hypothetical protein ACOSP7_015818 [Xanthoceras sorbifolium]